MYNPSSWQDFQCILPLREQFQQELLQFRLYLHTYSKSPSLSSAPLPSLPPKSFLLFFLSFSEFKHNQQNSNQNKTDWTREVRNQLHQTLKTVKSRRVKIPQRNLHFCYYSHHGFTCICHLKGLETVWKTWHSYVCHIELNFFRS